jgi:hypothetical protein
MKLKFILQKCGREATPSYLRNPLTAGQDLSNSRALQFFNLIGETHPGFEPTPLMTKSELVGNATTELSYHILRDNGKYSYLFSIQNMIDFCFVFPKNWKYFNFVF